MKFIQNCTFSTHQYRKYDLYKMKQFHWLLCVVKNFDWSRKIAPLSNLTRASLLERELTAKAELNCEIYKSTNLVKFEIKQWFSAYQDQVCAWFSLARLPSEAARELFLYHFLKEMALSFVFWLLEPVQCLGKTFLYLIFCPVT